MRVQHVQNRVRTKPLGRNERRQGFTLVEVLMVVVIIGILIALLVPAVNIARRAAMQRAIAMECQTIANAIEQYKTKYGDYPPDGSSSAILERHLRKIFPQIAASELTLLTNASNSSTGGVMDPPEALVFFLGGFSNDPVHPFTGAGGPFAGTASGSRTPVQYNTDRANAFYPFNQSQLSLTVVNDPDSNAAITISDDETTFGHTTPTDFVGDVIPVYRPSGKTAPFVYFNNQTYGSASGVNSYSISGVGTVAPYLAGTVNTKVASGTATFAVRTQYFDFVNDKSFQLISAGLDDLYGVNLISSNTLFVYRPIDAQIKSGEPVSGEAYNILGTIASGDTFPTSNGNTRFASGTELSQQDNVANFSEGILLDSVPN